MGKLTRLAFDGYLKYHTYQLELTSGMPATFTGGFVHGPGHHIAAVAAFAFDHDLTPHPILKSGDTRLSRFERGQPYVLDGFVAGRMDKEGADSSKIALAELAEEVGGQVVGTTFRKLGELTPTMPFESTEADHYYMAAVEIVGRPSGDGGLMEVADLIAPRFLAPLEAWRAMDQGEVSEGGRTRALFGRGFDALGYLPQLGVYIHDHPQLAARYDPLGAGPVQDLRPQLKAGRIPEDQPPGTSLEARINHVVTGSREVHPLSETSRMVDSECRHAVDKNGEITVLEGRFLSQYLQLDYDRAKLADYYLDPERGPMISLQTEARPVLAFSPGSPEVLRLDVQDLRLFRNREPREQLPPGARALGRPTGASPGQSDLYYHFYVRQTDPPQTSGFVTLSQAIRLCRSGHGDAHTEALCARLALELNWIPNLNMSVEAAKQFLRSSR